MKMRISELGLLTCRIASLRHGVPIIRLINQPTNPPNNEEGTRFAVSPEEPHAKDHAGPTRRQSKDVQILQLTFSGVGRYHCRRLRSTSADTV